MPLTYSEENYLKAIFRLYESGISKISTNAIAAAVETAPASVTDMLQRLADKKLVHYERYQGVSLTTTGKKAAISVVRKHRLWELFLVDKLGFNWGEVHEIAEQLEHIQSESLVKRLYEFLGKPKWDPHGDPIPDEQGNFHSLKAFPLNDAVIHDKLVISGVVDHQPDFLNYLEANGLIPGRKIGIKKIDEYDKSMTLIIGKSSRQISSEVARNILVSHTK